MSIQLIYVFETAVAINLHKLDRLQGALLSRQSYNSQMLIYSFFIVLQLLLNILQL